MRESSRSSLSACSSPPTRSGCRWLWRRSAITWAVSCSSAIRLGSACSRPVSPRSHLTIGRPMTAANRNTTDRQRIRIGISACLLGDEVRYDAQHKRDAFLTETLGPLVEWVKVCPEVESGMGTPREPIRLVAQGTSIHLRGVSSHRDHTASMTAYSTARVAALSHEDLCGYVLKKDSPSCGMTRVKVYGDKGRPSREGVGLFAQALLARFPQLPVEEEGRLSDPRLRDNFI